jgi:hypothetical protein
MQSANNIAAVGAIIGLLNFTLTASPALAGGGDTTSITQTTTVDNTTSTSPTSVTTPISSTPSSITNPITQVNQQSGIVNFSGSSNLIPPSCNGGCVFAVTRVSPATYGSGTNLEAIVGITVPIGSNDNGAGEVSRVNAEMHKYRTENDTKLALSEKLSEALESGRMERAKVIAIILYPLLGYKDYQSLLRAVSNK